MAKTTTKEQRTTSEGPGQSVYEAVREAVESARSSMKSDLLLMGSDRPEEPVRLWIPTGSRALDRILGGGIPCGRSVEIFGPESSGKSTLLAHIFSNCQKLGGISALIDSEQVWNKRRMIDLGVDPNLHVDIDADTVEDGAEGIWAVVSHLKSKSQFTGRPVVIGWDTLHASPTKEELGEAEKGGMGLKSRSIQRMFRRIARWAPKNDVAIVIINQVIADIGRFSQGTKPTGGWALKHYPSIRIKMWKQGTVEFRKDEAEGVWVHCRTVKNKLHEPYQEVSIPLLFSGGISTMWEDFFLLVKAAVLVQKGGWFRFKDGLQVDAGAFRVQDWPSIIKSKEDVAAYTREKTEELLSTTGLIGSKQGGDDD